MKIATCVARDADQKFRLQPSKFSLRYCHLGFRFTSGIALYSPLLIMRLLCTRKAPSDTLQ